MSEETNQSNAEKLANKRIILQIENLTKKFDEIIAVNDVSFEVKEGEIVGIIGANGSGKTTLFNMLSGVHKPTSGKIFAVQRSLSFNQKIKKKIIYPFSLIKNLMKQREERLIDGRYALDIGGMRPDLIINEFGIARTFQIVRPFKFLTTQENVTVPHIPRNLFAGPSKLKSDGLRSLLAVDLGEKKNYPALILPHGDLKRLDIARTLACDPIIILLDEPFSGLSTEDAFRVTQLIKRANEEFGATIMIVEHKLKLLSNLVKRIVVLDQGSMIASGTPAEIAKDKRVIDAYLGKEASHIA
ncbi:MAG: ABC transporter ATP-binding protein [Candidatus Heimdallarchaeota archaeon]